MREFLSSTSALAMQNAGQALAVDPAGLGDLRRQASAGDQQGLEASARAFEALLVGQMLKQMRSASLGDGLFDSSQSELYRDMHDQQIAQMISEGEGLGIRDMLMQQLSRVPASAAQAPDPTTLAMPQRNPHLAPLRLLQSAPSVGATAANAMTSGRPVPPPQSGDWPPASPEDFVRVLRPQAEAAAAQLGVDPLVLLAQSALETGWGQRVPRRVDGRSSYNLFGIKAHGGWTGDRVAVGTLEYRNGLAQREQAQFRAYASPAESFADYVDFLRRNPRYHQVLASTDSRAFVRGLQQAGYATDPEYANKVLSIHNHLNALSTRADMQNQLSPTVINHRGS